MCILRKKSHRLIAKILPTQTKCKIYELKLIESSLSDSKEIVSLRKAFTISFFRLLQMLAIERFW